MTTPRRLLSCLAFACAAQAAQAASGFGVSPLRLDLNGSAPMGTFTITNSGDTPVVIQAQPRLWRQVDGRDVNEPTRALLVNPAIVTLQPGEVQVVRVALRAAPERERETGFRMHFTEVPQPGEAGGDGMNIRLVKRMDVPVFVAPVSGKPRPAGEVSALAEAGTLKLDFGNSGTAHWRLGELVVADARTGALLGNPTVVSVLPGGARRLELPLQGRAMPGAVVVRADAGGQPFEARLEVAGQR